MGDRTTSVKFYNQAVTAINDKSNATNAVTAFQLFVSACYADPTHATAWFQNGNNCFDLNKHDAAIASYRRALFCEQTPQDRAKTLCNLGWNLFITGKVYEAHRVLLEAVGCDPHYAASWINLSNVCGILDMPLEAVRCAKNGYDLDPQDAQNEVVYAFALLFNRQLVEGFKHFECRFRWKLHSFLQYPYPRWEGGDIDTLFLVADQGLGDTLSFSRFVRAAAKRCKYIHAYIQPELYRLFTHAFIDLNNVNLLPFGSSFPSADAWTTFVSLPFALKLTDKEIRETAPIEVPRLSMPTSWMVPDAKLHIGIAWKGSELNNINKHRSISLEHFFGLYQVPGIQLYSLQVGEHHDEANATGGAALVKNLVPYVRDVVDTLSLLRDLDLVITCESALGHICSLIGKECIIPTSFLGRDYRIGHTGEDRLWSPQHHVFRQSDNQRWEPVFDRVADYLRGRMDAKEQRGAEGKAVSRPAKSERFRPQGRGIDDRENLAVRTAARRGVVL